MKVARLLGILFVATFLGVTNQSTIAQSVYGSFKGTLTDVSGNVATKILALQTNLQAAYQTTSMLYQTSLVKFLPIS